MITFNGTWRQTLDTAVGIRTVGVAVDHIDATGGGELWQAHQGKQQVGEEATGPHDADRQLEEVGHRGRCAPRGLADARRSGEDREEAAAAGPFLIQPSISPELILDLSRACFG